MVAALLLLLLLQVMYSGSSTGLPPMRGWLDWTAYSATDVWGSVYGGGGGSSDGDYDYDYSTSGNSSIVLLDQGIVKVRVWRGDSASRMGSLRKKRGWGLGARM